MYATPSKSRNAGISTAADSEQKTVDVMIYPSFTPFLAWNLFSILHAILEWSDQWNKLLWAAKRLEYLPEVLLINDVKCLNQINNYHMKFHILHTTLVAGILKTPWSWCLYWLLRACTSRCDSGLMGSTTWAMILFRITLTRTLPATQAGYSTMIVCRGFVTLPPIDLNSIEILEYFSTLPNGLKQGSRFFSKGIHEQATGTLLAPCACPEGVRFNSLSVSVLEEGSA